MDHTVAVGLRTTALFGKISTFILCFTRERAKDEVGWCSRGLRSFPYGSRPGETGRRLS